jgi:hypothetical protein
MSSPENSKTETEVQQLSLEERKAQIIQGFRGVANHYKNAGIALDEYATWFESQKEATEVSVQMQVEILQSFHAKLS